MTTQSKLHDIQADKSYGAHLYRTLLPHECIHPAPGYAAGTAVHIWDTPEGCTVFNSATGEEYQGPGRARGHYLILMRHRAWLRGTVTLAEALAD